MIELEHGAVELSALDENDFLGVKIQGLGDAEGRSLYEVVHPYGFYSRPPKPDASGRGCNAFHWDEGRESFALLLSDPRSMSSPPNIRDGETCWYGPKGQFGRMHEDGSISLCTTEDGSLDGRSIFVRISPTVTEASGRVRAGLEAVTPWGNLSLGPNGFHASHSSGAQLDMGAIGGLPAPLDQFASYATLKADMISLQASVVALGTDGGGANQAAVTALLALLTTWAAIIDAKSPSSPAATTALATAAPLIAQLGAVV